MSLLKAALTPLKNQQHGLAFEYLLKLRCAHLLRLAFAVLKNSPKHWIVALNTMISVVSRERMSDAFERLKTHTHLSFEDEKRQNQKRVLELFGNEVVSTELSTYTPVLRDDDDFQIKALWGGGTSRIKRSEWDVMYWKYGNQTPQDFVFETEVICNKNGAFHRVTLQKNLGTDDLDAFHNTVGSCYEQLSSLLKFRAPLPMLNAKGFEVVASKPVEKDDEEYWIQEYNELVMDTIEEKRSAFVSVFHQIRALERSVIPTDD